MATDTGAPRFLGQQRAIMGRSDSRPSLAAISVPTLLVRGDQDGISTPAHQDEILAGIDGSRLEAVADCGHLPTLEKPVTTNRILTEWLARVA